eukprot:CAMPEP_0113474502 /NCGR_PEP_ID=MMETSP0014_2-20120614/18621_1 /TAXON_ID=2857 /ORGANISM="Nitzschia sp." /LENGTH=74 /DNA_ID=CAMNT_0000367359 /DNA_START=34 /DNA_END=255 /DNA_ORIENTATION=- /assembly_acc=CAM_ASM_000159
MTTAMTAEETTSAAYHRRRRRQQQQQRQRQDDNDMVASMPMSTLSKIQQNTDYVAAVYEPPAVFQFVGTVLDTK